MRADDEGTGRAPSDVSDPCPRDPSQPVNMSLRVAAVPYRRSARGIEFLLVRTRNRRAWTFPKGHLERGESPSRAAVREAEEEASVSGRIDPRVLTRYRYPTLKPPDMITDVCVEAYLLEVEASDDGGRVEGRRPTWMDPVQAVRKLSEGRMRFHAREHLRVVREALDRLQVPEPGA